MYRAKLQHRRSSILPVVGACLAVYAVCAVGFRWWVEPSLAKNQPPPAAFLQYPNAALAAGAEPVPVTPVAARPPVSTAVAPAASKTSAKVAAKAAAKVAPA